jgi:hypothetical protein
VLVEQLSCASVSASRIAADGRTAAEIGGPQVGGTGLVARPALGGAVAVAPLGAAVTVRTLPAAVLPPIHPLTALDMAKVLASSDSRERQPP